MLHCCLLTCSVGDALGRRSTSSLPTSFDNLYRYQMKILNGSCASGIRKSCRARSRVCKCAWSKMLIQIMFNGYLYLRWNRLHLFQAFPDGRVLALQQHDGYRQNGWLVQFVPTLICIVLSLSMCQEGWAKSWCYAGRTAWVQGCYMLLHCTSNRMQCSQRVVSGWRIGCF